jgi:hypothetical protein
MALNKSKGSNMITIAWYNIVAVIVGIAFIAWINSDSDSSIAAGISVAFKLLLMIIFFAVWGGLFWW